MEMQKTIKIGYTLWQTFTLTFLRVLIGWHFLYEGLVKFYNPAWTAKPYLTNSIGPVSPLFKTVVANESILTVVNILNTWGLILIGLGLFIGLFSKYCKIAGIVLLSLYYLAYPPFAALGINPHVEGSYWIVNKNLIEIGGLLVLLFSPSSYITGIDRFFLFRKTNPKTI